MSPPVRPRGATGLFLAALSGLLLALTATAALASAASASPASASPASAAQEASTGSTTGTARSATAPQQSSRLAPDDAASDTPTPTPTPGPPQLDPLPSRLVTTLPLTVSGTAGPGEVIDVSGGSSTNADSRCTAAAGHDGRFRCAIQRLPDGPGVPVRAESRSTGLADSGRIDVLTPPTITSADGGATGGGIRGTAYPGAAVTVTADTGGSCSFPADSTGSWGCVIPRLRDGAHTVSATQVAPFSSTRSGASRSITVVVDTVAPGAPTLTTPAPGTTAAAGEEIAFGGAGEPGATVTVYASTSHGTTVACTATVTGAAWSCGAGLKQGDYLASALQRDIAGNVSAGSNAVAISVEAAAAAPPATTKSSPSTTPAPAQPAPPTAAPPPPSAPTHSETKGWTDTPFSTASAPVVTAASVPGWLRSVGLAVAALLLLVLPARLLVAALSRPREPRGSRTSLFGRNRTRSELGEADALLRGAQAAASPGTQPVWLAPVIGVTAAALVTLSTSVQDAAAYVRLLAAVALAVIGVNAIWVLAARGMTRHLGLSLARPVVRPGLLVVVAATALGSRLIGLEPALLFGLVLGAVLPEAADRIARGRTAAVQLSATAACGVLAWLTVGVLPTPSGDASAFVVELANSVALIAIGSTAIALLPFGGLAGRAVLRWSRPLWLALALVVYTLLFALLLPVASLVQAGAGVVTLVVAALVFAVLSVSVWLWERYVEPAR
ncbi:Ig-like domain-containing protein [Leifsonia sp. McL0607]|uniref:Ig-like domain-containing protein n=1 Tax=Leifsonia sp. McL0607 TaxID=3415672 RepID=UPI003CEF1529